MKLLIVQFSPISCYFIPLWSKYSPQHAVDFRSLQFTVTHALRFSVSTSHPQAKDLNTETSTSNRYEAFLPSITLYSYWHAPVSLLYPRLLIPPGLSINLSLNRYPLHGRHTDNTENNSSDSQYSWNVTALLLRGSVFTEPLCRSGLRKFVVPLLRACIAGCLSSRCLAVCWHVTICFSWKHASIISSKWGGKIGCEEPNWNELAQVINPEVKTWHVTWANGWQTCKQHKYYAWTHVSILSKLRVHPPLS
jgi:hypothetical protein